MNDGAPQQITFYVEKRRNVYAKKGHEWALSASFDRGNSWTLCTWDGEPDKSTVERTKLAAMHAMFAYHKHLTVPRFRLTEV